MAKLTARKRGRVFALPLAAAAALAFGVLAPSATAEDSPAEGAAAAANEHADEALLERTDPG
ncbi:MAG: hypothetical protein H0W25_16170, partial [Acidimicrobiia bacterium]|nr:hypothetical protein [Acidimicrobiia bacterium]